MNFASASGNTIVGNNKVEFKRDFFSSYFLARNLLLLFLLSQNEKERTEGFHHKKG